MTDKEKKEYIKAHIRFLELVESLETEKEKALDEMCDAESRVNTISRKLKELRQHSSDPRGYFNKKEEKKEENEWFSCESCGTLFLGMNQQVKTCNRCNKGDKSLNLLNIYQSV